MLATSLKRIVLPALALLAVTAPGSARPTQSSFDGRWSVVIMTDAGTCDASYRYGLLVSGGRLSYEGNSGVIVSGAVDPRGRVSVGLRYGESAAQGSGHLSEIGRPRPLAGRLVRRALLGPLAGGAARLAITTSEGLIGTDHQDGRRLPQAGSAALQKADGYENQGPD